MDEQRCVPRPRHTRRGNQRSGGGSVAAAAVAAVAAISVIVGGCTGPSGTPGAGGTPTPPASAEPSAVPSASQPGAGSNPTAAPVPSSETLGARLVATIAVDPLPCALAFDGNAAWVTSYGEGIVDRVDAATNKVTGKVMTGGVPCGVAVGSDGRVWVADLGMHRVVAIDRTSLQVTAQIGSLSGALWDLKAGFGAVWVVDRANRVLLRIDPASATVVQRIPIGPSGSGLAIAGGAVWVADSLDGTIRRIDPATNVAVVTATLAGGAIWFADDGTSRLAVSSATTGQVTILDAATGAAGAAIGGWIVPRDGTVLGSTAWIPDGRGASVRLIDLATGTLTSSLALPGGTNPFVAEVVGGDVWVLDFGATTIWRIRG